MDSAQVIKFDYPGITGKQLQNQFKVRKTFEYDLIDFQSELLVEKFWSIKRTTGQMWVFIVNKFLKSFIGRIRWLRSGRNGGHGYETDREERANRAEQGPRGRPNCCQIARFRISFKIWLFPNFWPKIVIMKCFLTSRKTMPLFRSIRPGQNKTPIPVPE